MYQSIKHLSYVLGIMSLQPPGMALGVISKSHRRLCVTLAFNFLCMTHWGQHSIFGIFTRNCSNVRIITIIAVIAFELASSEYVLANLAMHPVRRHGCWQVGRSICQQLICPSADCMLPQIAQPICQHFIHSADNFRL